MISKVEIRNFQSHKDTTMEFVPGTNVIIGASDAGKSAVFRAINWVISNRPLGDAFRSEWGGDTSVTLTTTEGDIIERIRTATKNEYRINGQTLTAFGHEVPEEAQKIIKLDGANIQTQMELPFLLAATPGEAARLLNRAANIDDIDRTMSGLKKGYNKAQDSLKHNRAQLEEYQTQMEQYENLPEWEARVVKIEEAATDYYKTRQYALSLEELKFRAELIEESITTMAHIPKVIELYNKVEKQHTTYEAQRAQAQRLKALTARAQSASQQLEKSANVDRAIKALQKAEGAVSSWQERARAYNALRQYIERASKLNKSLSQIKREVQRIEDEYHKIAPEVCPLCGNKMEGVKGKNEKNKKKTS